MNIRQTLPKLMILVGAGLCSSGLWAGPAATAPGLEAPALPAPTALTASGSLQLPTTAALEPILQRSPAFATAEAQGQAALAQADALRRGSNEFNLSSQVQSRQIRTGPDQGRYTEWQVGVQRPVRWPGQAQADAALGKTLVQQSRIGLGDARHETLREILRMLTAVQRNAALAQLSGDAAALLQTQVRILEKRQSAGDASLLELDRIRAEAAQEEAMATQDRARAEASLAAWQSRFPELSPHPQSHTELRGLKGSSTELLSDYLAHNHQLLLLQAQWNKAMAQARQAHAQEWPQPTLGAYLSSERGGNERIVGVQLSMPIPSGSRRDQTAALTAEATAARARLAQTRELLQSEFLSRLRESTGLTESATQLERAYADQWRAAQRAQRAYTLGESPLSDWLQLRRQSLQTARALVEARYNAAAAQAELLLDSHQLWSLAEADGMHSAQTEAPGL
ncbi:TolC family protein [Acidithiobacillus sp.]|uniref:TolC family protein n=1 Tax=Acidithiobacillus sp. TaxID=1872118 RepID=UPI0025BFFFFF|nr:TolC family protein [Acidithiobacillus sp.]